MSLWLCGMLCHAAHASLAVAVYDPRLAGYVIVQSHQPHIEVGYILPLEQTKCEN
jgi:CRISPR-associated Csx3 family protein